MKLTKREDLVFSVWLNGNQLTNSDWQVFGEIENDTMYFSVQDKNSTNQLKIKIQKVEKHENSEENQFEDK